MSAGIEGDKWVRTGSDASRSLDDIKEDSMTLSGLKIDEEFLNRIEKLGISSITTSPSRRGKNDIAKESLKVRY